MATNAPNDARTVHVHGAEVSTDQSQLWDYAEALAVLVVMFALLAAIWIAAAPRPDADLVQPDITPVRGTFVRVPNDTRDVYQPETEGPGEVAVIRPGAAIGAALTPDAAVDPAAAATADAATAPATSTTPTTPSA